MRLGLLIANLFNALGVNSVEASMTISREEMQAMAQVLHNLWFQPPSAELLAQFSQVDWCQEWPLARSQASMQGCELLSKPQASLDELLKDYSRLFIGPGVPLCPPWGSVYLCETGLLNDVSTQALMAFYRQAGINIDSERNEPLDHMGLLLAMLANGLGADAALGSDEIYCSDAWLAQLLAQFIMTFAPACIDRLADHSDTDYYRALALLTRDYLQQLTVWLELQG
ncbi:molecular chaperone TorD [Shewanella sp. SNU WT4]|nr:molecular chaperone TorD [Shewanella sp. SNU WT4]